MPLRTISWISNCNLLLHHDNIELADTLFNIRKNSTKSKHPNHKFLQFQPAKRHCHLTWINNHLIWSCIHECYSSAADHTCMHQLLSANWHTILQSSLITNVTESICSSLPNSPITIHRTRPWLGRFFLFWPWTKRDRIFFSTWCSAHVWHFW